MKKRKVEFFEKAATPGVAFDLDAHQTKIGYFLEFGQKDENSFVLIEKMDGSVIRIPISRFRFVLEEVKQINIDLIKFNEYHFGTIGQLRKMLEDLPDDRLIIPQVVAEDGTAWNMWAYFCPLASQSNIAVLTLKHIDLETLPKMKTK